MKLCKCGQDIPTRVTVDAKRRNLSNRTKCLTCLPFKTSIYSIKKSPEEIKKSRAAKFRRWYAKNSKKMGADPIKLRRNKYKLALVKLIGGACQLCNYSKCIRNLAFHHLYNKSFNISSREFQLSLPKILPEILKCILVCHNCHGEIHAGLIDNTIISSKHISLTEALNSLIGHDWDRVLELSQ